MSERVIIIGASGHGRVVADIVAACGDCVVGFLDDDAAKLECGGFPVMGTSADVSRYLDCRFLVAVGNNSVRRKIAETLHGVSWYTAIHPSAIISPRAIVGEGTVVMPNAVINAEAKVGRHCIINTGAVVEHENTLVDYVHISPRAALGGNVTVGELTHVGIGACVKNNTIICSKCVIGAGAVVVNDIRKAGIYVGIPAKIISTGMAHEG